MDKVDQFYPYSEALANGGVGAWMSITFKLRQHRESGNQSKLANRIGQLRRHYPNFSQLPDQVVDELKLGVEFLRAAGRSIDLASPDPKMWISNSQGTPRW